MKSKRCVGRSSNAYVIAMPVLKVLAIIGLWWNKTHMKLEFFVRLFFGLIYPILTVWSFDGENDLLDFFSASVLGLVFFFSNRLEPFLSALWAQIRDRKEWLHLFHCKRCFKAHAPLTMEQMRTVKKMQKELSRPNGWLDRSQCHILKSNNVKRTS